MNNPLAGTDPSGYRWCGAGSLEKAACGNEQKPKRRDAGSVGRRAAETIWINGGPAVINGARHSPRSAATSERERGAIGGPGEIAVSGAKFGVGNPKKNIGAIATPNLMYGELAEGVTWGDFSSEEQEYVINQDKMISKATADILAIPPNSVLDTQAVKRFRNNYASIKHVFHNTRLRNGSDAFVHALVAHNAWGKKGRITRVAFSSVINYSSSSMANFTNVQLVIQADRKLGYHANLRAGMNALYDLSIHEMAHTFNQANPIGLTGAEFQKQEETRADSFLKEIRGY
ncbi:hypothetical protein [Pseudidiomarina sediminum]|uniref:hypothetical protein n=1 Tax=Pseudidiomarina sediminum TaxID=431675 RepID=UPI001C98556C|nr:hypothetical protein [Pseudidiomarina sediminum]MBY6062827.1 hypothetical protein [Pseudidiomarina sediminum]